MSSALKRLESVVKALNARWVRGAVRVIFNRWTGSLLLALFLIAWYAGRPSGELQFFALSSVLADSNKLELATEIFHSSEAAIEDASKYHRLLSRGDAAYQVPIPRSSGPVNIGIRKIIRRLSVTATFDEENSDVFLDVDVVPLLEQIYEWFGWTDYLLVFKTIEPKECLLRSQNKCWRVVVQYWPLFEQPNQFIGTKDSISKDLAVLVLRGALKNVGEGTPHLPAAATPKTMAELKTAATGMEILKLGTTHADCLDRGSTSCIDLARSALKASVNHEKRLNPVAAYGLALVELHDALRAAKKLEPDLTIEHHLNNAREYTSRAAQSSFLSAAMKDGSHGNFTSLLELPDVVTPDALFELAQRFACGLAEYRRARWKNCISKIGKLSAFPESLRRIWKLRCMILH